MPGTLPYGLLQRVVAVKAPMDAATCAALRREAATHAALWHDPHARHCVVPLRQLVRFWSCPPVACVSRGCEMLCARYAADLRLKPMPLAASL